MKLTDPNIKKLPAPAAGNRVTYDDEVKGFGVRITAAGARSFVLNYRTRTGRERRYTIGQHPAWTTTAARAEAKRLKTTINMGADPLAEIEAGRDAKTVADLAARFIEEHSKEKNRESTTANYQGQINNWILPKLKHVKVVDVTFADVDGLHRHVRKEGGPYAANRVLALLSKMFNLAIRWQWRTDNPAKGVERNQEERREFHLSPAQIDNLTRALEEHQDQQAANVIRLLLLTGSRRGEVLTARWEQFNLEAGVWTKPSAHTKQRKEHRVPLSAPARMLLSGIRAGQSPDEVWVFPGRIKGTSREGIKRDWEDIRKATGLTECRIHDLRHTYASILASAGMSLPIIGRLLGHTQPGTTARYAHLQDDPLRVATERVGAIVDGSRKPSAEVVEIGRGRG